MAATESAKSTMPTTAEIVLGAAALLKPILPPDFFGKVILIYENGKPLRMMKEESMRL